ncbi:MAG: hypothetical protein M3R70_11950 [Actinomycetota bacterium]|nr:hypothetical protein [Actinomycetota bacterium]
MRTATVAIALTFLAGCGASGKTRAATQKQQTPAARPAPCRALAHAVGYRGCGHPFPWLIQRNDGTVVADAAEKYKGRPVGFWRKVILSPDEKTLLAQWSGACEIQITFFVSTSGGKPRAVTGERDWADSPESEALRWSGRRALVRLPDRGETVAKKPGVYLIDPATFRRTLVRPIQGRQGC